MATGSELQLIVAAEPLLAAKGLKARLVSMPCWELFEEQTQDTARASCLRTVTARLAVEAGRSSGWAHWVGLRGVVVGLDRFGASAPTEVVMKELGFTKEAVAAAAGRAITESRRRPRAPRRSATKSAPRQRGP